MRWVEWFDVAAVLFVVAIVFGFALRIRYLQRVIDRLESEKARIDSAHVCLPPRWGAHPRDPFADEKLGGNWLCPCGTSYVINSYAYDKRLGRYCLDWITTEEFVTGVRPAADRQQRPPEPPHRYTLPGKDPRGSL